MYCCLQYPPGGFGFVLPVKPTVSIKVSLNSQRALLSLWCPSFLLLAISLGQGSFCNMRRTSRRFLVLSLGNNSHCYHAVSLPSAAAFFFFYKDGGVDPARAQNAKHIFSRLITACLTRALCCYLQASTFIPTQCDTSQVPSSPAPPPLLISFLSPSYLASIQRHRLGTGLYRELLLIASPTSSSSTSTVPLALHCLLGIFLVRSRRLMRSNS